MIHYFLWKNISCYVTKHSNSMLIFKRKPTPKDPLTKQTKNLLKDLFKLLCNSDNKCYTLIYSYCIIVYFNLAVSL